MKLIDWVAILGALAWTPHLYYILKKALTKSEIRIITGKFGEIGFTTLGPIFNMRLAFSVKNHDIVISNIKVRISHENGEEKLFEWQGIRQNISTMTTPDGSILPNEKEHSVLAIKLKQYDIEERFIQFQEAAFINGKNDKELAANRRMGYLKHKGDYEDINFLDSQEMVDLYNYIKHSFSWKSGNYVATIEIDSPEKYSLIDNQYEFFLSSIDIEELEKNKGQVELSYQKLKPDKSNMVKWNWRNPPLKKRE